MKIEKYTNAISVSGWSICSWGNPKLTAICGNCEGLFNTRQYVTITNRGNKIALFCPYCHYYNLTNLVQT